MRFFWVSHFDFFCFISMKTSSPFIWGIIYFCNMDGFFRIMEKTSSELICTRLYLIGFYFGSSSNFVWHITYKLPDVVHIEKHYMHQIFSVTRFIGYVLICGSPGFRILPNFCLYFQDYQLSIISGCYLCKIWAVWILDEFLMIIKQ